MSRVPINTIEKESNFVQNRKIVAVIRCPVCHRGKLLDATEEADMSAIRVFGSEKKNAGQWFLKCPKCGRQIGIAFGRARREPYRVEFAH